MNEINVPPQVAIVGRPNVGKSTLFNRILGRRLAIVDDRPGVTRDSIMSACRIRSRACRLMDTGGLSSFKNKDEIEIGVDRQILSAMESSDVILFVVDSSAGPVPEDEYVAGVLRRLNKNVLFLANKADGPSHDMNAAAFHELGMGEPRPISALHGRNIEDLLDAIAEKLPESDTDAPEKRIRFCIVGRPNVGKSSITNAILGQERCIVSSIPGTTRDSVETDFEWGDMPFSVVDTAGQRRNKKALDSVEFYSITRAKRAITACDVAVLVIDARDGLLEGEKRIAAAVQENKRGFLIAVNKMDLIDEPVTDFFIQNLLEQAPFLRNTPIVFVSALHREGMEVILEGVVDIYDRLNTLLPLEVLKNLIYDIRAIFSPHSKGRKFGEIKGVVHDRVNPPRIVISVNDRDLFHTDYMRLIENRIRDAFNLTGVPLDLSLSAPPKKERKK